MTKKLFSNGITVVVAFWLVMSSTFLSAGNSNGGTFYNLSASATIVGKTVTLDGTASAGKFQGNFENYQLDIDRENDGVRDVTIPVPDFAVERRDGSDKGFDGNRTQSHTYTNP